MVKSSISEFKPALISIYWNRFIRYVKVGFYLHLMAVLGFWLFGAGVLGVVDSSSGSAFLFYKSFFFTWVGFVLLIFSELDAFGRYQNYKLIKDKLHVLGFDGRLVKPFMYSNCQRIAILVAASDLNFAFEVKKYLYTKGYRWYHILPETWTRNPIILFKKSFWEKILFTKRYQLQNFYW